LPSLLPRIGILIKIIMMTTAITALLLFFLRELFYPLYFHLKGDMHLTNKKNNRYFIAVSVVAVALFTFAIMATAASNIATTAPAAATTAAATTAAATTAAAATPNNTTTTTPSAIELSPEPFHQEQQTLVSEIPINETHNQFTFSGNGNLNLPNGTINITSTGSVIASMDGTAVGEEVLSTEDGTESATATFYAIGRFNMEDGSGRSIIIALVHTNSTGQLAPLNGAIVAGEIEFLPDQTSLVTLWEWQSGIPLPTSTTESMEGEPPIMNTTTMIMTNATTPTIAGDDINATGAVPEEEVVEEQQQQATPTAPSPLFE
jgi:hypothetical protein